MQAVGDDLLIAFAGGAIVEVLAGIGFVAVRLSAVPGDVARRDRRAAALDEDLERWVGALRRARQSSARARDPWHPPRVDVSSTGRTVDLLRGKQTAQPSEPHSEMVRRIPRNRAESTGIRLVALGG
jgi:hypothetical protein